MVEGRWCYFYVYFGPVQGRYYKRVNNSNHLLATSEVVDLHLQSLNSSWDAYPDPVHTMDDISLEKVQKTIEEMRRHGHHIVEDPLSFLLKYNLIRGERPSNAAYLLFKQQDCFLSTVELGYFQTDIIIKDSDRSKSDLLTQIREIMSFVQKHINKEIIITGEARNTERWQYPLEAIREIVMNMVIHRDYRSSADSIVKVYPDKIEFFNPGKLPDNITVEDLMNNTYRSQPRNKLIADFCKDLGLIEKYGSGIRRVLALFRAAGLPDPQFQEMSGGFNVTVFSNVTENRNDVTENVTENRSIAILKIMKENSGITTAQLAKILGVTRMTIHRDLDELKSKGRIRRIGSDKGGHWEVVES